MAPNAPVPAAPKTAGGNRPQSNARPVVVPVIPLPLVQKQQQQRQQREQKQQREQEQQEKKQEKKQDRGGKQDKQDDQEKQEKQEKHKKHYHKKHHAHGEKDSAKAAPSPSSAPASKPKPAAASQAELTPPLSEDDLVVTSKPSVVARLAVSQENVVVSVDATPEKSESKEVAVAAPAASISGGDNSAAPAPETAGAVSGQLPQQNGLSSVPPPSSGLPSASTTMPEFAFSPHAGGGGVGPPGRPVFNMQHAPRHHAHPSTSSITFGAFHESNNSSPAPNGRMQPPPPPGLMGGPPFMPFNHAMGPGEWSGPPPVMPMHGTMNGYAPAPMPGVPPFPPSSPGSFHGSHSPDTVDGNYGRHHGSPFPVPGPNGSMPPRNDAPPGMLSGPPPPPGFPGSGMAVGRNADTVGRDVPHNINYKVVRGFQHEVQSLFGNYQTADCHLVLHLPSASPASPDPTAFPFFGHRMILTQSYTIAQILHNDMGTLHPGPFGHPMLVFRLNLDDPYLTAISVQESLQSLYGYAVRDVVANNSEPVGHTMDRALANLATGFLFMLPSVETAGVRQVTQLISWDTVEKVLAYCLNGAFFPNTPNTGSDVYGLPYPGAEFRYGRGPGLNIRLLLRKALDFIIQNFPADFVFHAGGDVPVLQSKHSTLTRFPGPLNASSTAAANGFTNGVDGISGQANGGGGGFNPVSLPTRNATNGPYSRRGSSKIMFGDFSSNAESTAPHGSGNYKTNGIPAADGTAAILSRILTNLPFEYLHFILSQVSHQPILAGGVIAERERLRQLAIDKALSGAIPEETDVIVARLQSASPPPGHDTVLGRWDVLGWKEGFHGEHGEIVRFWARSEPKITSQ